MLALYALDGDSRLYEMAADNAHDAQLTARATKPACTCSPGPASPCPRAWAEAGRPADAGRHEQPVRVAGGLPAAAGALEALSAPTPLLRRQQRHVMREFGGDEVGGIDGRAPARGGDAVDQAGVIDELRLGGVTFGSPTPHAFQTGGEFRSGRADQVLHAPGHLMPGEEGRHGLGGVAAGIDRDGDDLHVRGPGRRAQQFGAWRAGRR